MPADAVGGSPSLSGRIRELGECARSRAWRGIDDILEDDVIPVVEGLELVRNRLGERARSGNESATHGVW